MGKLLHKNYTKIKWIFTLYVTIQHLFIFNQPAYSQNLVKNYSFEKFSICPGDHGQINHCLFWKAPGEGTTDYCNNCNNGQYSVPVNMWGTQNASDGKAYAHIIAYYPLSGQYREYLQSELACELIEGKQYNVSFRVSLSDKSMRCIDRMGIYFSNEPVLQSGDNIIFPQVIPQIRKQPGTPLTDKNNWMQISGVLIAGGGEKYITIGNFKPNDSLTVINAMNGRMTSSWQKGQTLNISLCIYTTAGARAFLFPMICLKDGMGLQMGNTALQASMSGLFLTRVFPKPGFRSPKH